MNYFTKDRDAWLLSRRGRITASECWKLFSSGRKKDDLFGAEAKKYIIGRVDEIITIPQEEGEFSLADVREIKWGIQNEYDGVKEFKKATGLTVVYNGLANPIFYEYGHFGGGSPDGEVIGESAIMEMKCPFNSAYHTRRLAIQSIEEFKDLEWEAYCQCQMNAMVREKEFAYYCSYDPRKSRVSHRLKIIKMPVDNEWQREFEHRYNKAIEMMLDILRKIDSEDKDGNTMVSLKNFLNENKTSDKRGS